MKKRHWPFIAVIWFVPLLMGGCTTSSNSKSFNLSTPNPTISLAAGSSIAVKVQIERLGGFGDPVALSVAGLDTDLSGSFDTPNASGATSTLTLSAQASAAPGTRPITISGTGGGVSKNIPLTLEITSPGSSKQPSIVSFTATPSSLSAAGDVKLQWNVTGATSLELDQGVGAVTPLDVGSKTVTVSATKTFILTAKNADGTVTATTDVTVGGPATLGPGVWDQSNWNEALWQ